MLSREQQIPNEHKHQNLDILTQPRPLLELAAAAMQCCFCSLLCCQCMHMIPSQGSIVTIPLEQACALNGTVRTACTWCVSSNLRLKRRVTFTSPVGESKSL